MPDDERRDKEFRRLLHEAHRLEPDAPSFEHVWRWAERQSSQRRRVRGVRRVWAPALAVGLVLVLGISAVRLGWFRAQPAMDLESLLGSVQEIDDTSLDFLLDTPGAELGRGLPTFGDTSPLIDPSLARLVEAHEEHDDV